MRMDMLMSLGDKGFRGSSVKTWEGEGEKVRDLMRVCVNTAKTIIVLGNGGDWVHSDQKVLRTILTMQGMPQPPRGLLLCDGKGGDHSDWSVRNQFVL
jgi:hypothetical protein